MKIGFVIDFDKQQSLTVGEAKTSFHTQAWVSSISIMIYWPILKEHDTF